MRALAAPFGGDVGDRAVAGIAVTLAGGALIAVLFHRWCVERLGPAGAALAVAALLTYPFAFYLYGAVYADALFVAAVLAAFLLLERDQPVLAGLAGAVASATRPIGAAVVIGLLVRALERDGVLTGSPFTRASLAAARSRTAAPAGAASPPAPEPEPIPWLPRRVDWRRFRPGSLAVLLAVVGLLAYVVYLALRFDEPFAFEQVSGARGWEQRPGVRTWFKFALGSRLVHPPYGRLDVGLLAQGLLTLGALALVPAVLRRFGWGYAAYVVAVVLLPALATKDFGGMGRYALAAFPCFAVVGSWLTGSRRRAAVYLGVSSVLLATCAAQYARWVYLS
jgi:hypothetical protein